MAGKRQGGNPTAVSDLTSGILDPVLRKRAGLSVSLVQSWEEIAGPRLAAQTRPERIAWPRRVSDDDPFQPATLVVACAGAAALRLQHETGELVARVNAFLGYSAIGRIKIVQKPVDAAGPKARPAPRSLSDSEEARLASTVDGIEDEALRASLRRLGRSVLGSR
ncbi:DUF721 domain-containing protein [Mesorhizobium xinjiangense]|uniref:DUF721 domain-containing protein n=1 Tax=Mesorhizobium xinjiangense TaxID=2678685 RepID=UPI0012EE23F9|nr:DciA family protein [Mesorhizobium xinjiangense]